MKSTFYHRQWDTEVVILQGESREALVSEAERLQTYLAKDPNIDLKDLSYTLNTTLRDNSYRLAIVASSLHDLEASLAHALKRLGARETSQIKSKKGIYFFEKPLSRQGKLAFLFPGEGSQYVNMLGDLCIHFPEVRACFDRIDRAFNNRTGKNEIAPSQVIFPPPTSKPKRDDTGVQAELWQMDGAVASVITANQALLELLSHLEIRPQAVLGHSTGEYTAFQASGVLDLSDESRYDRYVADLDEIYQRISLNGKIPKVKLVAVGSDSEKVSSIVNQIDGGLYMAMDNCPNQVVIVGIESDIERAIKELNGHGLIYQILPFDRPYHTFLFKAYVEDLRLFFERWLLRPPEVQIYSCTTGGVFSNSLEDIRKIATEHWVRPVRFKQTIEKMYEDGIRIFVEVGPKGNLTAFTDDILRSREHVAVAANVAARSGITQLNHMVGMLAAHGVPMRLDALYARRDPVKLSFDPEVGRTGKHRDNSDSMKLNLEVPRLQLKQGGPSAPPDLSVSNTGRGPTPLQPAERQQVLSGAVEGSTGFGSQQRSEQPSSPSGSEIIPISPQAGQDQSAHSQPESRSLVLEAYIRTMEHFLEVQQEVMHSFLAGNETSDSQTSRNTLNTAESPASRGKMPEETSMGGHLFPAGVASGQPPVPDPQESQDGIPDSMDKPATLSPADGEGQSSPIRETPIEAIDSMLLAIVSEKTGYPEEMLDLNLDMEADLGIDSIKRIEILGTLSERCGLKLDQDMEKVAALKTLQHVIDFLRTHLANSPEPYAGFRDSDDALESGTPEAGSSVFGDPSSYPMIGEVVSLVPGHKLEAIRRISLDEDRYLYDHTLGGKTSFTDDTLLPLPVMPLTLSMEILAEAGALLFPGKVLVRMKDIRAHRWISLETDHVDLKIVAQVSQDAPEEVHVRVYKLDKGEAPFETLVIEGIPVFAKTYPQIPSKDDFTLRGERASKWTPKQLYTEAMFHGPSWHAVSSVDLWGEDGSVATLEVLPANDFFSSEKAPRFVIDPIVLDAAGQIVGFWTMEHLEKGFLVFPYRVKGLHIYRAQLPEHQRVKCQARIKLAGTQQVSSDIDMIAEDGGVWMRLEAWEDKRFDLPAKAYAFLRSPIKMMASTPWDEPVASFLNSNSLFCHRIDKLFEGDEPFWRQVFGRLILNQKERETFRNLGKSEKRLNHWLLGRLVAKDAVRMFLRERFGMEMGPADVEITSDEYGRPMPTGTWAKQVGNVPCLSLAHTDGMAVAVAGHSDGQRRVGIDVEKIRPLGKDFETAAFTPKELELLNAFDDSDRQQWLIRFWSAKEALAKALGRGLVSRPLDVEVQQLEPLEGEVKLSVQGKFAKEFPDLRDEAVSVRTLKEEHYIVASTAWERNGHD